MSCTLTWYFAWTVNKTQYGAEGTTRRMTLRLHYEPLTAHVTLTVWQHFAAFKLNTWRTRDDPIPCHAVLYPSGLDSFHVCVCCDEQASFLD